MENENTDSAQRPRVLFDALKFGLEMRLMSESANLQARLRERLKHVSPGPQFPDRIPLLIPIGKGGSLGSVKVELLLTTDSQGVLRIKGNSSWSTNGMRLLRHMLEDKQICATGLDGNDNFVGDVGRHEAEMLDLQLLGIRQAVEGITGTINDAMPQDAGCEDVRVWLSSGEVCRDIVVSDAQSVVRWLSRTCPAGTIARTADLYRASATCGSGALSMRYWQQMNGPIAKIYAKTETLLRVEISCPSRKIIRGLGCRRESHEMEPHEVEEVLLEFGSACSDLLEDLAQHALAASREQRTVTDLLEALAPLVDVKRGVARPAGRPPGAAARSGASECLEALCTAGFFDARSHRVGTALRTVLDDLSTPHGPLQKGPWRATFSLRPNFGRAMDSFVGISQ